MLRLVIGLRTDSKYVEDCKCMRGSDGMLCYSEKEIGIAWKDHAEGMMNEENDWYRNVEGHTVEDPIVCAIREELHQALNEMKTGKATGPTEVSRELIAASGDVGIRVMFETCQKG